MTTEKVSEKMTVEGLEIFHTYRGYNNEIEVYTQTVNDTTYSLYRKPDETAWHCDWSRSYNCQPISLEADPTDKEATLKAFVALLKSASKKGH